MKVHCGHGRKRMTKCDFCKYYVPTEKGFRCTTLKGCEKDQSYLDKLRYEYLKTISGRDNK